MSEQSDYLLMFEKPERERHSLMWAGVIARFPWYSAIRVWQFISRQLWLGVSVSTWAQRKGKSCKQYRIANEIFQKIVVNDILGQGISPYYRGLIRDTDRDAASMNEQISEWRKNAFDPTNTPS